MTTPTKTLASTRPNFLDEQFYPIRATIGYGFISDQVGEEYYAPLEAPTFLEWGKRPHWESDRDQARSAIAWRINRTVDNYICINGGRKTFMEFPDQYGTIRSRNNRVERNWSFAEIQQVSILYKEITFKTIEAGLEKDVLNNGRQVINIDLAAQRKDKTTLERIQRELLALDQHLQLVTAEAAPKLIFPESMKDFLERIKYPLLHDNI
ncbi:MAG: hypothetical protein Q7R96_02130 [Nanoarchaeota archaeon]|nr:hypothetical protein [Nanoarchaeota archaeon]